MVESPARNANTDSIGASGPPNAAAGLVWPGEGVTRVPYWVYSDAGTYDLEQERIFAGRSWNYAGLNIEIPKPGDFKRTSIGDRPIVIVRAEDGRINAFVNKCAHRGVQFCRTNFG